MAWSRVRAIGVCFVVSVLLLHVEAEAVVSSPPSAACPGSTPVSNATTTTTAGPVQQPGDTSVGSPVVPGLIAVTTTATTEPPPPVYAIVPESVSIEDGDEFTASSNVRVAIVGPGAWKGTMGAATRAELSNDGGFKTSKFFDLVGSKANVDWTLESSREGTFTKIVYVRFWNCYGSPAFGAGTLTDDVILDNTKPIISGFEANQSTARASVQISRVLEVMEKRLVARLSVRGGDSISGVGSIEIRTNSRQGTTAIAIGGSGGSVSAKMRSIAKTVTLSVTARRFQLRLVDRAGNASPWKTVKVSN